MNKYYISHLIFLLVATLVTSCSPPEPNFDLNNDNLMASSEEPADYMDSTLVKRVFANDKIILTDISGEQKEVKKRFWDTNDDGEWDPDFKNKDFVEIAFEEEGFHKIVFCVNKEDNCISKWVYVLPDNIPGVGPKFFVFEPNIETPDRSYDLEVETENIFSEEELSVKMDGEEIDFEFDPAANKLSASISGLKRGEQTPVEITASTTDGEVTEYLTITRQESGASPAPIPDKPSVRILDVSRKVKVKNIRLKANTRNYTGDELLVTLNNRPVSDYRSSGGTGNWVINLDLREGSNTLVVSLPDKSERAKAYITYEKEESGGGGAASGEEKKEERPVSITFADYSPGQTVKVSRSPVEVKLTTENVSKNNLVLKLGSKKLTENNYKRVRHYGPLKANADWVVTLDLERNKTNIFSIEGKDVIQRVTFVYEDEKPASGAAGLKAPASTPSCLKNVEKDAVTATLRTGKSPLALQEFSIYTSSCGRVEVSLNGPGYSNTFYASVIDIGKSQIIFEDLPELEVNSIYQLTIKPRTGGGCSASVPPLLKSAENCGNLSSHPATALTVSEPDGKFIFDLKY